MRQHTSGSSSTTSSYKIKPVRTSEDGSFARGDVARIFGSTALLNVVLCAIAIPLWGMTGAAYASAASHIIWRAAAWYGVRQKVGISCAIF